MLKKILFFLLVLLPALHSNPCRAQDTYTTSNLLKRDENKAGRMGVLKIYQDPRIDSLINRYILYNMKLGGLDGFRIQIYSSSNKNARDESGKVQADFMNRFPGLKSNILFERPGYYKIRVGDYRTRIEGTKDLLMVRKFYPDAYLVPDLIKFPDLN